MAAIFELDIKVQDEVGEMPALPLTAMARCGNNPGLARRRREPLCRGKRRVSPMVPTTIWFVRGCDLVFDRCDLEAPLSIRVS